MDTKLKKTRKKLQLTQLEIAKIAKIKERSYQYIEANERTPNVKLAIRIAKALNSTVEELFEDV